MVEGKVIACLYVQSSTGAVGGYSTFLPPHQRLLYTVSYLCLFILGPVPITVRSLFSFFSGIMVESETQS